MSTSCLEINHSVNAIDSMIYHRFNQFIFENRLLIKSDFLKNKTEGSLVGKQCLAELLTKIPGDQKSIKKSISHHDEVAICILTDNTDVVNVGIDIETIMSNETVNEIYSILVNKNEHKLILEKVKNSNYTLAEMATLIFSAKETLYKANNPINKIFLDFTDVEMVTISDSEIEFKILKYDSPYKQKVQFNFLHEFDFVCTLMVLK